MNKYFSKSESRNLKKILYPFDDLRIWAFEKIPCFQKRRTRPIIFRDLEPWEFVHIHTTYQDHTGEQFSGPWTNSHGSIKSIWTSWSSPPPPSTILQGIWAFEQIRDQPPKSGKCEEKILALVVTFLILRVRSSYLVC